MAKKKYTKEEIKQKRKEQRQKAALKSYRYRGLKNFLFYLTGFLTSIVILVTALFVGLKVVPIKTYLGDDSNGVVSEKVSSKSIIDALLSASTYDMNDFPVVVDAVDELLDGLGANSFIEIDKEKVKNLDFNTDFTSELLSCIRISESGAQELLSDFGNLDVFQNKWDIIPTESDDQPQTDIAGNIEKTDKGELLSNPKLYYFQKPVDGGTSPMSKTYSGSYEWARAFDDDGHPINGYTGTQPLYYANLTAVPIVDILDLIDESLGRVSLDSIIDIALKGSNSSGGTSSEGGSGDGAGSEGGAGKDTVSDLISKLFKGKTIKDITGSKVDTLFNDVLIIDLDLEEDVLEIIKAIAVDKDGNSIALENITIGNLTEMDLLEYLSTNYADVLAKLEIGQKPLTELLQMPYESSKTIYDLLYAMIDWDKAGVEPEDVPEPKDLTIGDLSNGIIFDNLSLSKFLGKYEDNKFTYDLLCSAVGLGSGEQNYSKLTVSHLEGGLNIEAVSLTTLGLGDATVDLLLKAANASRKPGDPALTKDQLTISHIKADMFKYLALTDVMPFKAGEDGNAQLYSILLQASGVTLIDPADANEISQKAQTLNISSLANFKIAKVSLSTILPISENAKLYDLLADATGKDASLIKISDFANFDPANLHLSTVITESDNVILQKMIESGATIGNLGDAIDSLSLYDIYGQNCFKERNGADAGNKPTYNKVGSGNNIRYDLDATGNGEYVISDEAGIWLVLCFKPTEGTGVVTNEMSKYYGCRESYTATTANMQSLQNGANIAGTIGNATIRELVIIGLIEDSFDLRLAYAGTLQDALEQIKIGK